MVASVADEEPEIPWFYQGYSEQECGNWSHKILHLFVSHSIQVGKTPAPLMSDACVTVYDVHR